VTGDYVHFAPIATKFVHQRSMFALHKDRYYSDAKMECLEKPLVIEDDLKPKCGERTEGKIHMRKLTVIFVLALSAEALLIGRTSALPTLVSGGIEGGNRGVILIEDPLTWIQGQSCPYGLTVAAKRYNRKLRTWQVKCAS